MVGLETAEAFGNRQTKAAETLQPLDDLVGDHRVRPMNRRRARAHHFVREATERIAHQTLFFVESVRQPARYADKLATERGECICGELRRYERIVDRSKICRGHAVIGRDEPTDDDGNSRAPPRRTRTRRAVRCPSNPRGVQP